MNVRYKISGGLLAVALLAVGCSDAEFTTSDPSLSFDEDAGADTGQGSADGGSTSGADSGIDATESDAGGADGGGVDATEQTPECPSDQSYCGGACVDTSSSDAHCGACDSPCAEGASCSGGSCESGVEVSAEVQGVLDATNAWRASGADCGTYGVKAPTGPLVLDPELNEAAQAHAEDMVANDFFDHTGSDGSDFSERVSRTDYTGFAVGENIAGGGEEAAGVVQRWVDSDGHCRNLMNPGAKHLGVGFKAGGPYGTMWVQVFGQ